MKIVCGLSDERAGSEKKKRESARISLASLAPRIAFIDAARLPPVSGGGVAIANAAKNAGRRLPGVAWWEVNLFIS